jgi:hypothetical protein
MSKLTTRDTTPGDRAPVEDRLARLLDTPFLARLVPHLPPEALHQIIRHRGLDACGELVTSATPAQLTALLDLDLWRDTGPGRDHRLDVDRFGEWIEVLVDTGLSIAARTVASLDKDLVVAGLSRYVRVLDPGIFEPTAQSDDEPADRHEALREGDALDLEGATLHESSGDLPGCEVGGYIVRARRADAWDAIVALLIALDGEHGNEFHAVMHGCRSLSDSRPEIDGLDRRLPGPEQQLHDVTIERQRRRSQQGWATPADARAFLEMARQSKRPRPGASGTGSVPVNPIVAAYFRAVDPQSGDAGPRAPGVTEKLEAVMELLTEAGLVSEGPRALPAGPVAGPAGDRHARLLRLMTCVRDTNEAAYYMRSRELAFLANTLLAGCSVQSRAFTPQEASDAAAATCNLGLEYWSGRPRSTQPDAFPPDAFLIDHNLVTAFEMGWSVLHKDVSLFAADELLSTLADIDCVDRDIRRGLVALRRTLARQREAGTPWRARGAAEILAMLDMTAWISVVGLLDECPVIPAALTAVLEGRTTAVSASKFEFISTAAQIGDVRVFMRKLPGLLSA